VKPARLTASDRLQRLLSLIPWVADRDGPSVDEVCTRFGISEANLLADLELVQFVGVPPYTPDELFEAVVEDGRVWIHLTPSFRGPLRLTPEQGLAVVAAGAGLLAVPGAEPEGPLARGLGKLATTLGVDPDEVFEIHLGEASASTMRVLEDAVASHHQVELDYYAFGRDERATRVVDPLRLYADQGEWYLLGFCHRADGERVFRVDRIQAVTPLASTFDREQPESLGVYEPRPDDPRVTLDLAPEAGWVVGQYPLESVEELGDGRIRVRMAISAIPWLERLLLRLGSAATVVGVDGDDALNDVRSRAARRVLARYTGAPEATPPSATLRPQ
jgi:proteasome accessory factor C